MKTLDMFTQENVCSTCIHNRYGCNKFSGMTAGWNDKGEGIIVVSMPQAARGLLQHF